MLHSWTELGIDTNLWRLPGVFYYFAYGANLIVWDVHFISREGMGVEGTSGSIARIPYGALITFGISSFAEFFGLFNECTMDLLVIKRIFR